MDSLTESQSGKEKYRHAFVKKVDKNGREYLVLHTATFKTDSPDDSFLQNRIYFINRDGIFSLNVSSVPDKTDDDTLIDDIDWERMGSATSETPWASMTNSQTIEINGGIPFANTKRGFQSILGRLTKTSFEAIQSTLVQSETKGENMIAKSSKV